MICRTVINTSYLFHMMFSCFLTSGNTELPQSNLRSMFHKLPLLFLQPTLTDIIYQFWCAFVAQRNEE